jgi:tetratricopeptide (TPR) repeat protein
MKPELSMLKTVGLALALGAATWLLVPVLLPVKLAKDFPPLPDLQSVNPDLRATLENADQQARRRPGSAEAVGKLGMAYHANLFVDQAARAYRIAARLAPGDSQWVYDQAVLAEENGNEQEQARLLQETVRLKPDHVVALLKLADWFFKLDKLDEAGSYYDKASNVPAQAGLLQGRFGLGRVAARRQDWNKVVESVAPLSPAYANFRPPYELLEEAYGALGQADKAEEARRGAAAAGMKVVPPPEDPLNEQLAGLCYSSTRLLKQAGFLSRTGHPDRALDVARRAALVDPKDPDVRYFIAHALLTSYGDKPEAVEEAVTQLGECLRLRPDDLTPLWNFSSDFFTNRRTRAALERLEPLLRAHASSAGAHLSLGMAAEAKGEIAEAVSQYEAALRNNPNDSVAHNKLGQIFDRAGKYREAQAHFERSLQLSPMNAVLRRNYGIALIQQGNYSQGVNEFSEVLRSNPYDVPTLLSTGFALLELKRIDEAVPKFREALRFQPDSPEGHYGLAYAYSAQGRKEDALPEVRTALKLRPEFPEAQQLAQRLEH